MNTHKNGVETVTEHRAGLSLLCDVWDLSLENSNGRELESPRDFFTELG